MVGISIVDEHILPYFGNFDIIECVALCVLIFLLL